MRQHLRQQPETTDPQTLHHRASLWYQSQPDMMDEAINHALQAGDDASAAQWIANTAPDTLWGRGEASGLQRQIERLPPDRLPQNPQLSAFLAWTYYLTGEPGKAERLMQRTVSELPETAEATTKEIVTGLGNALQAFITRANGDLEQSITLSRQALAQLAGQNIMLTAILYFNLGAAYDHSGNLTQASQVAQELLQITQGSGNTYLRLQAMDGLAGIAQNCGQLHQSYDICQEALRMVGHQIFPGTSIIQTNLANLLYEWNELEQSEKHIRQAIALGRQSGFYGELQHAYFRRAMIALRQGDKETVERYRKRIWQLSQNTPTPFIELLLKALLADLDLQSGHLDRAWRWLETSSSLDTTLPNVATMLRMPPYIVAARVVIARCRAQFDADLLSETVQRLQQLCRDMGDECRIHFQIKLQLLLALAYDLRQDKEAALAALTEALTLAEPSQYCRTFIDHGLPMAMLLKSAQMKGVLSDYSAWLLSVFASENIIPGQQDISTSSDVALAEPLHEQEMAILRLIAVGLTNRQIADELYLSVNTVKWYIKRLYEKLDVHNRVEAIARAKELGLIPGS
jgi:LuxR family maltose regulon positive regulatory protein